MPVGVPEHEVYAAADAVLARGERPTVERVRAELGRGSPARVGKLLETWWDALAKRLAGETRLPDLPADVASAFGAVWSTACAAADRAVHALLAEERAALAQLRSAVEEERRAAQAQVEVAKNELEAARQAVASAERLVADREARIGEQGRQLDELRQAQVASSAREAALREERDRAHTELSSAEAAWAAERERLSAHLRSIEDRAHAEVDRAREEAKRVAKQLRDLERTAAARDADLRRKLDDALRAHQQDRHEIAGLAAKARTLEAQLERMDGLPAALLAAQEALADAGRRLDVLQQQEPSPSKPRAARPTRQVGRTARER